MSRSTKEKLYRIPVAGYIVHLIEAFFRLPKNNTRVRQLLARTGVLEARLQELDGSEPSFDISGQRGTADKHLPALLNAIETVPALSHEIARTRRDIEPLQAEIGKLWQRLEFVRMEVMYEMNYGLRQSEASGQPRAIEQKILSSDKVAEQMRELGGVRLNLGCGHVPLEGYLNTDMRALPGVDIVAEVSDLPFEAGQAREIFSAHLLEHFPQERLVRALLPHWYMLLADGGEFRAITPDGAAMIDAASAGTYTYEDFRTVLFGAQEYDGDFHFNLLTPHSLSKLLEEAGFSEVKIVEAGRRNGRCFEFEISARKTAPE